MESNTPRENILEAFMVYNPMVGKQTFLKDNCILTSEKKLPKVSSQYNQFSIGDGSKIPLQED